MGHFIPQKLPEWKCGLVLENEIKYIGSGAILIEYRKPVVSDSRLGTLPGEQVSNLHCWWQGGDV